MFDEELSIRGVAHDINGLMASASLSAENLSGHEDAAVALQAGRISRAIDKVVEICRDTLVDSEAASQAEALAHNDVDHMLRQIADLVSAECVLADRPIDFFVHVNEDVRLKANPQQLFRILFNLALNAANAISRHGGSWIEISAITTGGRVLFDVCDDGPGLPPHILSYLFPNLAVGVKPRDGRIGCGLITSVHLASEMKGELRLNPEYGPGTNFCLTLQADIGLETLSQRPHIIDAEYAAA